MFVSNGVQPASGGLTPWKKIHEIRRPTQITKPKMLTKYTATSLPKPSRHSSLKSDNTPIEKNVSTKKIRRSELASATAPGTLLATSADVPSAGKSPTP